MKIEPEFQNFTERYNTASSRLILLDYEGILGPRDHHEQTNAPGEHAKSLVRAMAQDERNQVIILSGHECDTLGRLWDDIPVILVAECGALYKIPGHDWQNTFDISADWVHKVLPSFKALTFQYKGSVVERRIYSIAWNYGGADMEETEKKQIVAAIRALPFRDRFMVHDDRQAIELRTPGIDKASFVCQWIGNRDYDFIMVIGDGGANEGLLDVLGENIFTVSVGGTRPAAGLHLISQHDVLSMLSDLLEVNASFESAMKRIGLKD